MAYKDIPLAADKMSVSQGDIRNNFLALGSVLKLGTFPADPGYIELTDLTTPANPVVDLYADNSVLDATKGALWVTFTPPAGGASVDYDITSAHLVARGWCRLPCGLIMQWGTGTASDGTVLVPFDINFNSVFSINITRFDNVVVADRTSLCVKSIAALNAGFYANSSAANGATEAVNIYFIALGI